MCANASNVEFGEGPAEWDESVRHERRRSRPLGLSQSLRLLTTIDTSGDSTLSDTVAGSSAVSEQWLRLTAVDALDRWLQAPIEPSLIEAERGLARVEVARRLDDGAARDVMFEDALGLTRSACFGLESYFQRLVGPVPDRLVTGLWHVVHGYELLAEKVSEADDLHSVVSAGRRALDVVAAKRQRLASSPRTPRKRGRRPGPTWTSAIDPRQLPARVLELSDDPSEGEVHSRRRVVNGVVVLDVEAPAFHALSDTSTHWHVRERLIARFVDRATGDIRAQQLLTVEPRATSTGKRYLFRTLCPLEGMDPERLRVDIVDAAIDLPPARHDGDPDLLRARRFMLALRDVRTAAACSALGLGVSDSGADGALAPPRGVTNDYARPLVAELALAHELALLPSS